MGNITSLIECMGRLLQPPHGTKKAYMAKKIEKVRIPKEIPKQQN
jgi:hypothetical protein